MREKNIIIAIDAMKSGKLSISNLLNELNYDFIKKYDVKMLLKKWLFKKMDIPFDLNFEIEVARYITEKIPNCNNSCDFQTTMYLPKSVGLDFSLLEIRSNLHPSLMESENFASYLGICRLFTTGYYYYIVFYFLLKFN